MKLLLGRSREVVTILLGSVLLVCPYSASAQVQVLTQHNDIARTGQNLNETTLNTSNVSVVNFGKLFSVSVDALIYAQPLYLAGVTVNGAKHNVLFIATLQNSVYAVDADNGDQFWHVTLGNPVPAADVCIPFQNGCNTTGRPYPDLTSDVIGIVSTPVIDPGSNTIYLVAYNKDAPSTYNFRLHALDVPTGQEKFGGPVVVTTSGFAGLTQLQRTGLLFLGGQIYLGLGSKGDFPTWHGYVMSYDSQTLQQTSVFNTSPGSGKHGSGIWESGTGLASDGSNIYVATSNGDFDKNSGGNDYGSSFIKLSTSAGLKESDYYAPSAQSFLNDSNADLGAGGSMLLPDGGLVGGGKDGILHVMDTAPGKMGGFNASTDQNLQNLQANNAYPDGMMMGGPVYWHSPVFGDAVYLWGPADVPKAWQYNGKASGGTALSTTSASQGTVMNAAGNSNEAALSISANGSEAGTGILWATAPLSGDANEDTQPGAVHAFDASNLSSELWNSTQNKSRDDIGMWAKFNPPTIANGKVYVASFSNQLVAYGLLVPPDFTIGGSGLLPTSVVAGSASTSTITVSSVNGFASGVTLSCVITPVQKVSPPTCAFDQTPITPGGTPATATLTVSTSGSTPAGTYSVTVTGSSGPLTHTTSESLTVQANNTPDFSISASAFSPTTVSAGATADTHVTTSSLNGFSSAISLSCSGQPTGVNCSFNPNSLTGSGTSTLAIATSGATSPGTYSITITGQSGGGNRLLTHSTTVNLTVTNPVGGASFTLGVSPGSKSLAAGASASATVSVTPRGGFSGTVTLSCAVSPSVSMAPSCSLSPSSVTGSGSATLMVNTTAPVRAASSHPAQVLFAMLLPIGGLALLGAGLSGSKKGNLYFILRIVVLAGLLVAVGCGGGSSSGGGTLTGGTPAGTYTITVSGTSGSISESTTVSLTVSGS